MKNAKITSASLGLDNDGTFTARIYVRGDSFGGSFGYVLGAMAESWVTGVLKCAGVEAWEDLPGQMIRVEDDLVVGATIERITHITDDEIYFDAKEWMAGPGSAAARAREANGVKLPRPKLTSQAEPAPGRLGLLDHGRTQGKLWAAAKLAPILSAGQLTKAKELLGLTDSEWADLDLPKARNLSCEELGDICWGLANNDSEDSAVRTKALATLLELVTR